MTAPAAFHIDHRPAAPGRPGCWLALPAHPQPGRPALVAVHGIRRAADEQALLLGRRAALAGRAVIAPYFDAEHWPTYQRIGQRSRSDLALLALLEALEREGIGSAAKFDLFGFSAGAQFGHRFAMLHPERLGRLCVASAGWYTFPDAAPWPYGIGTRNDDEHALPALMRARLDEFLALPIRVCVGIRDNRRDENTRAGVAIDRQQGLHRRDRAARWAEAVARLASARGIHPRVRLSILPGAGHDFHRCVTRGGLDRRILPDPGPASASATGAASAQLVRANQGAA